MSTHEATVVVNDSCEFVVCIWEKALIVILRFLLISIMVVIVQQRKEIVRSHTVTQRIDECYTAESGRKSHATRVFAGAEESLLNAVEI